MKNNNPKKIIYSAIIGDYDAPKVHDIPEGWEYRLYTNTEKTKGTHLVHSDLPDKKFARLIKIMPWKFFDFDICIWIDGNTIFDKNAIEELTKHDFVISKHPRRDCIYDEAEALVYFKREDPALLDLILKRYRQEHMPSHIGMVASHAILRKNTVANRRFCEEWWSQVKSFSYRDQMSFNYILWKNPIPIHYIEFNTIFKVKSIHKHEEK